MLALMVVGVGYATSGQGVVRGAVVDRQGKSLADCRVDRGLRVGLGLGGFDGVAHATGAAGQFAVPVNRGLNRLTFACPGGVNGSVTSFVLRGRHPEVAAVVDVP